VVTDNLALLGLDTLAGGTPVCMYRQRPPGPPRVRYEPAGGAIILCCTGWTACSQPSGLGHVLYCFRSYDPAISLTPVPEGPAPEAGAAAREGVQEAVEIMAARFECNMEPEL
jgi:hypothetical protein